MDFLGSTGIIHYIFRICRKQDNTQENQEKGNNIGKLRKSK